MKRLIIGALGAAGIAAGIGATVVQLGWVDVAADTPHSTVIYDLLQYAREQSIARRTRDVAVPADLSAAERVRRGAGNYDAMCVGCHLSPGAKNSEIRQGLYPTPPNLSQDAAGTVVTNGVAARQFWIIKHGIKASGMPAWSKGGMDDESIWGLVAFVQKLPSLSPEQYREAVAASEGHSHGGIDHHAAPEAGGADHDEGHHHHAHESAAEGHQEAHKQGEHHTH